MPVTVSTSCQLRWKDCVASSSEVDLSVVSNGEEPVQIYTPQRTMVPAGIEAPTVAATMADGGTGGDLPAGNVAYLYCYASSAYPDVNADTTAGGFLWPKSQPSPVSAIYTNTVNHKINVTVATTTRADIDKILIYRTAITAGATAPTYTSIVEQAGQVFYVGFVQNNPAVTTVTYTDNIVSTQEELEVDNFPAPQFWKCVFIDPHWYGIGNPDLAVDVTIDSSGGLTATYNAFYSGRNGQLVTFDGVTKGGFDGLGTFYYLYNSATVGQVSLSADLSTQDFPGYVGTTTMRVRGFAGTLYRSKNRNPFAWGYTEYQVAGDSQIRVTQQFAQQLGGYGVALAVMPQQRLLKIDMERPSRCYAIDVSVPLESNFQQATRTLDTRYIVTAHDSQFQGTTQDGNTALRGIDASNFSIVQSDSGGQAPISDSVFQTLRKLVATGDEGRFFHGAYDSRTELSAFWFKTSSDPEGLIDIDTCLLYHGPTGQWSLLRDFDVTASATVYDSVNEQNITLIGTASGQICQAFCQDVFWNIRGNGIPERVVTVTAVPDFGTITIVCPSGGASLAGQYFDLYPSPTDTDRFWFGSATTIPPAAPLAGRLIPVLGTGAFGIHSRIATALSGAGYSNVTDNGSTRTVTATPLQPGVLPVPSLGTSILTSITISQATSPLIAGQIGISGFGGWTLDILTGLGISPVDVWVIISDSTGANERWVRVDSQFVNLGAVLQGFQSGIWVDPSTMDVSTYPGNYPQVGYLVRLGLINCEAQTYFQPSQTVSGQRVELWSTRTNSDAVYQWCRLYAEFDAGIYESPFQLVQTKRGDNVTGSDNWTTSTQVPTGLMAQFGIRFIERGYGDFTMFGFTLFGKGTRAP